jgi:membrane-associated phospholipid phosphatase
MENWYALQSLFVAAIQGLGGWLEAPMKFFSFLGSEEFYLLALPILYWCIDAGLGLRVGLILLVSAGLNDSLKMAFHTPRPYWFSTSVQPLSAESSFGVPSGHAQNAVAIWGIAAAYLNKRWAWISAATLMLLIGFSRLYLGVHFPQDVLVGWGIGAFLLWGFARFWSPAADWLKHQTAGRQIGIAAAVSLLILLIGSLPYAGLSNWTLPLDWAVNAARAGDPLPDPVSMNGILTSAGTLFGLVCGLVWMNAQGGYQASGPVMKRVLRLVLGVAGVLILRYGLGAIFPSGETLAAFVFRYLRYALIGAWVSGGAPFLFVRLKLVNPLQR